MSDMQPSPTKLVRLLRERLGRTDTHDIADDYGHSTKGTHVFYDRLIDQIGPDAVISALVGDAVQRGIMPLLLDILVSWRRDLSSQIGTMPQVTQEEAEAQLKPITLITGGTVYIVSDIDNSNG